MISVSTPLQLAVDFACYRPENFVAELGSRFFSLSELLSAEIRQEMTS